MPQKIVSAPSQRKSKLFDLLAFVPTEYRQGGYSEENKYVIPLGIGANHRNGDTSRFTCNSWGENLLYKFAMEKADDPNSALANDGYRILFLGITTDNNDSSCKLVPRVNLPNKIVGGDDDITLFATPLKMGVVKRAILRYGATQYGTPETVEAGISESKELDAKSGVDFDEQILLDLLSMHGEKFPKTNEIEEVRKFALTLIANSFVGLGYYNDDAVSGQGKKFPSDTKFPPIEPELKDVLFSRFPEIFGGFKTDDNKQRREHFEELQYQRDEFNDPEFIRKFIHDVFPLIFGMTVDFPAGGHRSIAVINLLVSKNVLPEQRYFDEPRHKNTEISITIEVPQKLDNDVLTNEQIRSANIQLASNDGQSNLTARRVMMEYIDNWVKSYRSSGGPFFFDRRVIDFSLNRQNADISGVFSNIDNSTFDEYQMSRKKDVTKFESKYVEIWLEGVKSLLKNFIQGNPLSEWEKDKLDLDGKEFSSLDDSMCEVIDAIKSPFFVTTQNYKLDKILGKFTTIQGKKLFQCKLPDCVVILLQICVLAVCEEGYWETLKGFLSSLQPKVTQDASSTAKSFLDWLWGFFQIAVSTYHINSNCVGLGPNEKSRHYHFIGVRLAQKAMSSALEVGSVVVGENPIKGTLARERIVTHLKKFDASVLEIPLNRLTAVAIKSHDQESHMIGTGSKGEPLSEILTLAILHNVNPQFEETLSIDDSVIVENGFEVEDVEKLLILPRNTYDIITADPPHAKLQILLQCGSLYMSRKRKANVEKRYKTKAIKISKTPRGSKHEMMTIAKKLTGDLADLAVYANEHLGNSNQKDEEKTKDLANIAKIGRFAENMFDCLPPGYDLLGITKKNALEDPPCEPCNMQSCFVHDKDSEFLQLHLSDAVDCTKCQKHKVHKECFDAYKMKFNAITAELQDNEILCTECFSTFERRFCGNNKQSSREICRYPLDNPNENTICTQCKRAVHDECISDDQVCHSCSYENMLHTGLMDNIRDTANIL